MISETPDELQDDEEMKEKLEKALRDAHPEENPIVDPFATDALGNPPAQNAPGGEEPTDADFE
jgi:hypothetical protein